VRWERFFAVEALRRRAERWWVDGDDWHSALAAIDADRPMATSRRYLQFYDYVDLARIRTVAPELAFPGERLSSVVGPIVDPDRTAIEVDDSFAARWEAIRSSDTRIVYVTLGTFLAGLAALTRTVIDAVQRMEGVSVVVAVGKDVETWRSAAVPDHVAVFGHVPQMEVLRHASLTVSTGGLNTGHESLWFGVPVLNLPVGGVDTPGNAARLAWHGVGRTITPGAITEQRVHDEICSMLDDRILCSRAMQMSEALRAHDATTAAARAIVALTRASEAPSPPR
jgi:UDP:flavonoid glycosyltransferase YjiC (YdhE family)